MESLSDLLCQGEWVERLEEDGRDAQIGKAPFVDTLNLGGEQ